MSSLRTTLVIAALALTVAACGGKTASQGVSATNPDLAHLGPFDSAIVLVGKLPAEERDLVEAELAEGLRDIGVEVVAGSELETVAPERREALLREQLGTRSADTLLVVIRDTAVERKRWVPPRTSPGYSYPIFVGGVMTMVTVPPTTVPGHYVSEEQGLYLAVLRHVATGDTLWVAVVGSQGDARADWSQVTEQAIREIIERLIGDGAFEPSAG